VILMQHAGIRWTDDGAESVFAGGRSWATQPHETHHYFVIAHRCGYGDDVLAYAREHDFCHHFVAERLRGQVSQVLAPLAFGREPDPGAALFEEMGVQLFQRWLRANERPILGGVDWDGLKREALALIGREAGLHS
jgi:hypothetical protein